MVTMVRSAGQCVVAATVTLLVGCGGVSAGSAASSEEKLSLDYCHGAPDAQASVAHGHLRRLLLGQARGESVTEQGEEQAERLPVQVRDLGQADGAVGEESLAGAPRRHPPV